MKKGKKNTAGLPAAQLCQISYSPSALSISLISSNALLKCCFTLYKVPEAKQEEVIGQILKMDLKPIAEKIIEDTVRKAEEGFEAVLAEK